VLSGLTFRSECAPAIYMSCHALVAETRGE